MFTNQILASKFKEMKYSSAMYDSLAYIIIMGAFILLTVGLENISVKIEVVEQTAISLEPTNLPYYALMSVMRLLIAVVVSIIFTLIVATLAAKSKKAESIIIPSLDILQSIPILGYISFTVTGFMALFPGSALGLEMAAIFVIFTSQVWNMTFSFYQSLKTIPQDLQDAAEVMHLSAWKKFWTLEVPFAMPGLIWNTMMSMSGSWFFIVASEAVSVGATKYTLPGIGSYIAMAIEQKELYCVGYAILAMFIVILLYDQMIFRPMVNWADKFRCELTASEIKSTSLIERLFQRASYLHKLIAYIVAIVSKIDDALTIKTRRNKSFFKVSEKQKVLIEWVDNIIWFLVIVLIWAFIVKEIVHFFYHKIAFSEVVEVTYLGFITLIRIMAMIAISFVVWVPIGVYIGLRPMLAERVQPVIQFLAAFPANLFFPIAVILILHFKADPNIWLSPLMILGTQWYILFNVIAGASAIPNDLNEASTIFKIKGFLWWRKVALPGIYPYLITGLLTATGAAWNASIVAEAVSWGSTNLFATGIGSYITQKTTAGDFSHIALGIFVMCAYVVVFNKLLWRPLYYKAVKMNHLD
ncbi:MAG: ABC transporter permease [Gammaproteobacteria bacterium]